MKQAILPLPATEQVLPDNQAAAVRIERAVAELRFGRPIIIRGGSGALAVLAIDAATEGQFERFRTAAANRQALYVAGPRANALGLENQPAGISIPLASYDFQRTSALAYGLGATPPNRWSLAPSEWAMLCGLAQIALLLPAFVFVDVSEGDQGWHNLLALENDDIVAAKQAPSTEFRCIASSFVPLENLGQCEFLVFRGGMAQRDQIAIVIGKPDISAAVPVRIHSSCITGDLLGSLKCDCGDQLQAAMSKIFELGGGVLLYLDHEGRGTGLATKLRAYSNQSTGLDTIEADAELGLGPDQREYTAAIDILRGLGIDSIALLTNNPSKADFLVRHGIKVEKCVTTIGPVRAENSNYLQTKAAKTGHRFPAGYFSSDTPNADGADLGSTPVPPPSVPL